MVSMPSTEAKTHFGALLDMAQRNPVTIEKKGRPVAVMISESEYAAYQQLKLQALQSDLNSGIRQADEGQLMDSETAFNGLI
jgi:prevent-host-death family protein